MRIKKLKCSLCEQRIPPTDFYKADTKRGFRKMCKDCLRLDASMVRQERDSLERLFITEGVDFR